MGLTMDVAINNYTFQTLQLCCNIIFTTFVIRMMKRSIAIFLIALASTIWLTHAILPHHHHNSQACLVKEHCQHDTNHRGQNSESNSHNHDNNSSSHCVLNQSAIVPQPVFKINNGFPEPPQFDIDLDFIQAIIANTYSASLLSRKTHAVYLARVSTTLYLVSIGQSLGLRAPPTV